MISEYSAMCGATADGPAAYQFSFPKCFYGFSSPVLYSLLENNNDILSFVKARSFNELRK